MSDAPHIPVLIDPILTALAPVSGVWVDGTFGAGGYARRLLDAGAETLIGIDRDPAVFEMAAPWAGEYGARLALVKGEFGALDELAAQALGQDDPVGLLDGVVLDLGVSSMQLDQAERGFSFMRDGPLDMRMGQSGAGAAELIAQADEAELADVLYHYGEERAARRIARAIKAEIAMNGPITTTAALAALIQSCLPRPKPGQSHPATRSFQAIRIWVNDEFGQLRAGLEAAERALRPGGALAVVSFHSLEDRVVKRFLQGGAGQGGGGSRHLPQVTPPEPTFTLPFRRAVAASEEEQAANPRARSALLRIGIRTNAPPRAREDRALGLPVLPGRGGR